MIGSDTILASRSIAFFGSRAVVALAATILTGVSGAIIVALLPLLVGTLVEHKGLSIEAAGDVAAMRMLGAVISSFVVAFITQRAPWRMIAAISLVAILIGNGASLLVSGGTKLTAFQLLTGLGEGGTTIVGAALAVSRNPDRGYGIFVLASLSIDAIAYWLAPTLAVHAGLAGLLGLMSVVALAAVLFVRWFPRNPAMVVANGIAVSLFAPRSVLSLLMMAAYFFGLATFWSCVERIGVGLGKSQAVVGQYIGDIYMIFGIAGAGISIVCGGRFGQRVPLLFALVASVLAVAIIGDRAWTGFLAGVALIVLTWMVAFSYMMAVLARIDGSGRLAVLGLVGQTACFSAGSWVGTRLLSAHATPMLVLVATCFILAIILMWLVTVPFKEGSH